MADMDVEGMMWKAEGDGLYADYFPGAGGGGSSGAPHGADAGEQRTMEDLPDEVLAMVLTHVPPRDLLLSVEPLNLRFRRLLADQVLWNYLLHKAAPVKACAAGESVWAQHIRAKAGWKGLLKARHLASKNWEQGNFSPQVFPSTRTNRYCLLFDEENDILLTGTTNGEVQQRRLTSDKITKTWLAHKRGYLYSMAFVRGSQGLRLATGALDQVVRLWDLDRALELCHLSGHTGSINALCTMPDERWLVSCSVDHTTRVWDLEKEECAMSLVPGESETIKSVNCVLPWGHREVMTANNKGELHVYDTGSGNVVASFTSDLRTVLSLLRNPQNENEILIGGGPLRSPESVGFPVLRYDVRMSTEGGQLVPMQRYLGNSEWVETATCNGLGHVVTGANDGSISVFDIESGECLSKQWETSNLSKGRSGRITCMQASPLRLVSTTMEGAILHWNFAPSV